MMRRLSSDSCACATLTAIVSEMSHAEINRDLSEHCEAIANYEERKKVRNHAAATHCTRFPPTPHPDGGRRLPRTWARWWSSSRRKKRRR